MRLDYRCRHERSAGLDGNQAMTAILDLILVTGFVLLGGLLVASVVALAIAGRRLSDSRGRDEGPVTHQARQIALDLVQERYERGEIDAAELEGRRALLRRER